MKNRIALILGMSLLTGYAVPAEMHGQAAHRRAVRKDPHTMTMVSVERGVRLETIDWGGKGAPLIFLAGLGNTAHVFDEFAPGFARRNHVFGITRRGFGGSTMAPAGYDAGRLVADIIAVMDSLRIKKAVFAGHSIAGDELTLLATSHPERTLGVIYLDAAYDHSEMLPLVQKYPGPPEYLTPQRTSNVPLARLRDLVSYAYGAEIPLNEFYQTVNVSADGNARGDRPNATGLVLSAVKPVDYKGIQAPVLAIFAIAGSPRDLFPRRYPDLNAQERVLADSMFTGFDRYERSSIDRVRREIPTARIVKVYGGRHYVFASDPKRVRDEMRDFLSHIAPAPAPKAARARARKK